MIRSEIEKGLLNVYLSSSEEGRSTAWYHQQFPLQYEIARQPDILIQSQDDAEVRPKSAEDKHQISVESSSEILERNTVMRGMGTSLDGSSVHHLMNMTPEQRHSYLMELLDPVNGVGFTQFRIVIGTSDFNAVEQDLFSYYDKIPEGNPDWENDFSIQPDIDIGLVSLLQEILEIADTLGVADEISFLASPWSPPGWMKENIGDTGVVNNELNLIGGNLKDERIQDLAIYFRRYIEEYAKLNIPIKALTLQNEPTLNNKTFPNCLQSGTQQAKVARLLREELKNSAVIQEKGYYTELWAWDYICDLGFVDKFLKELEAENPGLTLFDGIAFHGYHYLPPYKIREISEKYPHLNMHITEAMEPGSFGSTRMLQMLRVNSSSYIHWVTCLNPDRRPNEWENSPHIGCWFNLTLSVFDGDKYWFLPTKNLMGQISRFVRPGCVMRPIERFEDMVGVEHVVYEDLKNNNFIYIVANFTNNDFAFEITTPSGDFFNVEIGPHLVGTYIYSVNN